MLLIPLRAVGMVVGVAGVVVSAMILMGVLDRADVALVFVSQLAVGLVSIALSRISQNDNKSCRFEKRG